MKHKETTDALLFSLLKFPAVTSWEYRDTGISDSSSSSMWGLLWCDIRDHWVGMQFAHSSGLFTHFPLVPNKLGLYSPFKALDKFHFCSLFLWQMVPSACTSCVLIVYMIISCSSFGFLLSVWCLFTCLVLAHCLMHCYSTIGTINP